MRTTESSASSERALDLADVYRRDRGFVRSSLRSLGVPRSGLEDALQDVFVVVHRRLRDYDPGRGSLRAWLFGISLRVARAQRRGLGRTCAIPGELAADRSVADPERYVNRMEVASAASDIVGSLPPAQWQILIMTDVEGMTGPEISETLGIKLGTVYTRLARARTKVRRRTEASSRDRWLNAVWAGLGKVAGPSPALASAAFVSLRTLRGIAVVVAVVAAIAALFHLASSSDGTEASPPDVAAAGDSKAALPPHLTESGRATPGVSVVRHDASLRGVVRNDHGSTLADASVCAWLPIDPVAGRGSTPAPTCTRTTAAGDYALTRLTPGARYLVSATAPQHVPAQAPGDGDGPWIKLRAAEARTGVDIVVQAGGVPIQGRVVDVLGGAIEGARVAITPSTILIDQSFAWPPASAASDADGRFEAWVGRGRLSVRAYAGGYAPVGLSTQAPGPSVVLALAPLRSPDLYPPDR